MNRDAYNAKTVLILTTTRSNDLRYKAMQDKQWKEPYKGCEFLKKDASLTKCPSGATYETQSLSIKAFTLLMKIFKEDIDFGDELLNEIGTTIDRKLEKYEQLVCCENATLAIIFDPLFRNDILEDASVLRKYVEGPIEGTAVASMTKNEEYSSDSFMKSLLNEDRMQGGCGDEITTYLRNICIGEKSTNPLLWWMTMVDDQQLKISKHLEGFEINTVCSSFFRSNRKRIFQSGSSR